ncbi:MAG TPA: outer membrane lipoprotein chaperone LolA [Xanthomonadaceae bacterium]|nr:outer membrane lipoprotein chaperone LolA [Xanthomonadaceae bacterium]
MSTRSILIAALLGSTAPATALAALPAPMAGFSDGLQRAQARFEQRVYDERGGLREQASGTVALSAPRLFRWEYRQPYEQLIVADGDHVWIYDPDLEQVTVRRQSIEEQHSPLAALIDPGLLEEQFEVATPVHEDGIDWVALHPRSQDAQLQSARLGFSGGELVHMVMHDALGQRTEIAFSGWRRNPVFEAGRFRFVPPEGVDVIGETIESAEVYPLDE